MEAIIFEQLTLSIMWTWCFLLMATGMNRVDLTINIYHLIRLCKQHNIFL